MISWGMTTIVVILTSIYVKIAALTVSESKMGEGGMVSQNLIYIILDFHRLYNRLPLI